MSVIQTSSTHLGKTEQTMSLLCSSTLYCVLWEIKDISLYINKDFSWIEAPKSSVESLQQNNFLIASLKDSMLMPSCWCWSRATLQVGKPPPRVWSSSVEACNRWSESEWRPPHNTRLPVEGVGMLIWSDSRGMWMSNIIHWIWLISTKHSVWICIH